MDTTSTTAAPHYLAQHKELKAQHPDAMFLFRVGDFYETFNEDAAAASETLGITAIRHLCGKTLPYTLAGFPRHALDVYLPKLVRAGRRVAICEQLESPATRKLAKQGATTNRGID